MTLNDLNQNTARSSISSGENVNGETAQWCPNFRPPLARREDVVLQVDRDEDPVDDQGNRGMGSDNDEQAEGDAARPRVRENNEVTVAMKEMTKALVNTIMESNRAISQNLTRVLEEVQRRQPTVQVTPVQNRAGITERGRRPGVSTRWPCIVGLDFLILMRRVMCNTCLRGSGHTWIMHSKGR